MYLMNNISILQKLFLRLWDFNILFQGTKPLTCELYI